MRSAKATFAWLAIACLLAFAGCGGDSDDDQVGPTETQAGLPGIPQATTEGEIPNVIGASMNDAMGQLDLALAAYRPKISISYKKSNRPPGRVIKQSPPAGSPLTAGKDGVRITVSKVESPPAKAVEDSPGGSLPSVPVKGAPCVPGQPLPPHLVCK